MDKSDIFNYFPDLTPRQREQIDALDALYRDWNAKINVISRKDIDNLYLHHVLHSLAIAKFTHFQPGTHILDIGTGGGFPGIPLAIMFPECQFRLIDSIGKKVRVAGEIAKAIGLENVEAFHRRAEEEHDRFHFVVSRAVMPLPKLVKIISKNISKSQRNALPNGLIVLKGGDLTSEIRPYERYVELEDITGFFHDEWFEDKKVVYLPL
jgi:16S rRNA (guanine527-N7)-methyltransferase